MKANWGPARFPSLVPGMVASEFLPLRSEMEEDSNPENWLGKKKKISPETDILEHPQQNGGSPLNMQLPINMCVKHTDRKYTVCCAWGLGRFSSVQLCDPMDCSLSGSSTHRILQARIPEWVSIAFSRGSSQPRDLMPLHLLCFFALAGRFFFFFLI